MDVTGPEAETLLVRDLAFAVSRVNPWVDALLGLAYSAGVGSLNSSLPRFVSASIDFVTDPNPPHTKARTHFA